jgi:hypothetical protein
MKARYVHVDHDHDHGIKCDELPLMPPMFTQTPTMTMMPLTRSWANQVSGLLVSWQYGHVHASEHAALNTASDAFPGKTVINWS